LIPGRRILVVVVSKPAPWRATMSRNWTEDLVAILLGTVILAISLLA
jgi:hypothetical protein